MSWGAEDTWTKHVTANSGKDFIYFQLSYLCQKMFEEVVCPLVCFATYSGNVKLITTRQEASTVWHVLLLLENTSLLELAKSLTADSALVTQTPCSRECYERSLSTLVSFINALFKFLIFCANTPDRLFDTCIRILCPGVGLLYANLSLFTLDRSTLSLLSRDIRLTSA